MIYVIKTVSEPAYIKIGFSKDSPRERVRKIQTGCPFRLEVLLVKEGDVEEEKRLHEKLEAHHFRAEWFRCNKASLELLGLPEKPKALKFGPRDFAPGYSQVRRWVNKAFENKDPPNHPVPWALEAFCRYRGFDPKEVEEAAKHESATFVIETTTGDALLPIYRRIKSSDTEAHQKFIIPKETFNMAMWQDTIGAGLVKNVVPLTK